MVSILLKVTCVELTTIIPCAETPRAGRRIFETGDENLLRLAHDAGSAVLATIRQREQRWTPMRHPTNVRPFLNAISIISRGTHCRMAADTDQREAQHEDSKFVAYVPVTTAV